MTRRADSSGDARRAVAAALVAAATAAALWHASPTLLWHLRLEERLRAEGDPARLRARVERVAPGSGDHGTEVVSAEIALRAPLACEYRGPVIRCAVKCRLPLAGGGMLAIHADAPPERYREALDRFAPDAGDVSPLRSVGASWRTIDALTDRVRAVPPPPASLRYFAPGSRGVVTEFSVAGTPRYVVYAYGDGALPARAVGLVRVTRAELRAILGSLRVELAGPGG